MAILALLIARFSLRQEVYLLAAGMAAESDPVGTARTSLPDRRPFMDFAADVFVLFR